MPTTTEQRAAKQAEIDGLDALEQLDQALVDGDHEGALIALRVMDEARSRWNRARHAFYGNGNS